jgi:hypothetical protein
LGAITSCQGCEDLLACLLLGEPDLVRQSGGLVIGGDRGRAAMYVRASVLIEQRTERLQDTLEDAAVLSTFTEAESLDSILEQAFNIHMTQDETLGHNKQTDRDQRGWNDHDRQMVLAMAIRMDNAFRSTDHAGLFEEAGLTEPGAAFRAMMHDNTNNGITLHMTNYTVPYTDEQRQQMLHDHPDRYSSLDQVPTEWYRSGAETQGAGSIDFYTITGNGSNEWIADATMFHFGHEFGHRSISQ